MVDVVERAMAHVSLGGSRWTAASVLVLGITLGCSSSEPEDGGEAGSGNAGGSSAGSAGTQGGGGSGAGSSGSGGAGTGGSAAGSGGSTAGTGGNSAGSGGTPNDGICRPTLVQPAQNPNATALYTLTGASLLDGLSRVHVAGENLVFGHPDGYVRIPKAGGELTVIYSTPNLYQSYVENDVVYWIEENALYSVPVGATQATATTVVETMPFSSATDQVIGFDATHIYLGIRENDEIRAVNLTSGTATALASGSSNQGWHLAGGFVYFVGANDTLQRVPTSGGTPEMLFDATNTAWSAAVDGSELYYGGSNGLFRVNGNMSQPLLYWDIGLIEHAYPLGDRMLFEGWEGSVGWVKKDASACAGLVDGGIEFAGWDYDDTKVYLIHEDVLYGIVL
jgi:hypothetical protein